MAYSGYRSTRFSRTSSGHVIVARREKSRQRDRFFELGRYPLDNLEAMHGMLATTRKAEHLARGMLKETS